MQNRIIVPANYMIDVVIKFDPSNGRTELQVRNRSNVQFTMWQVAGLLAEHTASLMRSLLQGKIKMQSVSDEKLEEIKPVNGGDHNAT